MSNPNAEFISEKLQELVTEVGGWIVFAALPFEEMRDRLASKCKPGIAKSDIEAAIAIPSERP